MTSTDDRCSVLTSAVGEPLAGTAPRARAWLVLEQPGPDGFAATTESHLPDAVNARSPTTRRASRESRVSTPAATRTACSAACAGCARAVRPRW